MYLSFSDFISSAIRVVLAPTALKLGGVANFKIVFLVVGFIWLVGEIKFSLVNIPYIIYLATIKGDIAT